MQLPASQTRHKTMKNLTLIGCFLILVPNGFSWYWGNMSVYVYSYIHFHQKTKAHDVKAPWLFSIYIIMWSSATLISGYLIKIFHKRVLLFFGILFFNSAYVFSYLVMDKPIMWLDLTMGLIGGFGNGIIFSIVLHTIIEWIEERVGLATSCVIMGTSIGATLINQVITHYLNPDNLKVTTDIGRTKFFSQTDILDKVPSIFLILVAVNLFFHLVALCLIRQRPTEDVSEDNSKGGNQVKDKDNIQQGDSNTKNDIMASVVVEEDESRPLLHPEPRGRPRSNSLLAYLAGHEDKPRPIRVPNLDMTSVQIYEKELLPVVDFPKEEHWSSKSPSQVLRSSSFYLLWFMLFSVESAFVLMCNYYKAFGEVWIKDDHFLTDLGTALSMTNIVTRIAWGLFLDTVETKKSLILFGSAFCLLGSFYYFTPAISEWLYFFWSIAFASLSSGVYINFTTVIARLYGREHFHTNFGLVFTATIVINLAVPPFYRFLLQQWGWFAVCITSGCLCFCSLILNVLFLPSGKR